MIMYSDCGCESADKRWLHLNGQFGGFGNRWCDTKKRSSDDSTSQRVPAPSTRLPSFLLVLFLLALIMAESATATTTTTTATTPPATLTPPVLPSHVKKPNEEEHKKALAEVNARIDKLQKQMVNWIHARAPSIIWKSIPVAYCHCRMLSRKRSASCRANQTTLVARSFVHNSLKCVKSRQRSKRASKLSMNNWMPWMNRFAKR